MFSRVLQRVRSSETLRHHSTLFISSTILNALSFVYQFATGRLLGPSDFGAFTALFSVVYITVAFMAAIQSTIAKTYATHLVREGEASADDYFRNSLRKILLFSCGASLVFISSTPLVTRLLDVSALGMLVVSLSIIPLLVVSAVRGRLQGYQKFKALGVSYVFEAVVKLVTGISLVLLGWGVTGALLGVLIGSIASLGAAGGIPFLRATSSKSTALLGTSVPILVFTLLAAATYTIDVFIAKARFPSTVAGHYAALSLFGKIMFYATYSIPQVIFAQAVHKHVKGEGTSSMLLKTIFGSLAVVGAGLVVFFIGGEFITTILLGPEYAGIGLYGTLSALAMGAVSISSLICMHDLAVGNKKTTVLFSLGVAIQIMLLSVTTPDLVNFLRTNAILHVVLATLVAILSFSGAHLRLSRMASS